MGSDQLLCNKPTLLGKAELRFETRSGVLSLGRSRHCDYKMGPMLAHTAGLVPRDNAKFTGNVKAVRSTDSTTGGLAWKAPY